MLKTRNGSNKTDQRARFLFSYTSLVLLLLFWWATPAPLAVAQSAVIQPCPATATTTKQSPNQAPTAAIADKTRVSQTLIDANIPDDPVIEKVLEPYSARVHALDIVIGKLEGELRKGGIGGGSLGSFVADGIRAQASARLGRPVLLAITNSGGLRKSSIAEGDLRALDIFELLPFENALIEVDLTGEQLLKLLAVVVADRDAQSGARLKYRMNAEKKPELIAAQLLDVNRREVKIDPKATYNIVTIDYLLKLGSGSYSILQQGKNTRPLGVTLRDAIMDYVKAETAAGRPIKRTLDGRFGLVGPAARKPDSDVP